MTSKFKTGQYLEWCTEKPIRRESLESPVFFLKGNEWVFRFSNRSFGHYLFYVLYLILKTKWNDFERCSVSFQVSYESNEEKILSVKGSKLDLAEYLLVCEIHTDELLSCKHTLFDKIKFRFYFDDVIEPLFKIINNSEKQPKAFFGRHVPQESQTSSNSRTNIHLEALSKDLSKLFDEKSSCDVKITCEDKTFHAHRTILQKRSAVFSAMLESNMVEGETGLINVEDFSASICKSFLSYLYSGMLPKLESKRNMEDAKQYYEIADKYAVEELRKSCGDFLAKNLCESKACEILVLADRHGDLDLRKKVISYIVDKKIPQRYRQWTNFCDVHCRLAAEVQNLYIQKYCQK